MVPSIVIYVVWLVVTAGGATLLLVTNALAPAGTIVDQPGLVLLIASLLLIPAIIDRSLSGIAVPLSSVAAGLALSVTFVGIWMVIAGGRDVAWSMWLAVATAPFWILFTTNGRYFHKFSGFFTTHDKAIVVRARELGLDGIGQRFSEPFAGVGFKLAQAPNWLAAEGMEDTDVSPDWRWTDEIPEAVALLTLSEEFPGTDIVYIEATETFGLRRSTEYSGTVFRNGDMSHEYIEASLPELLPYLHPDLQGAPDFDPALSSYTWSQDDPQSV
jgi:hypothetical protein